MHSIHLWACLVFHSPNNVKKSNGHWADIPRLNNCAQTAQSVLPLQPQCTLFPPEQNCFYHLPPTTGHKSCWAWQIESIPLPQGSHTECLLESSSGNTLAGMRAGILQPDMIRGWSRSSTWQWDTWVVNIRLFRMLPSMCGCHKVVKVTVYFIVHLVFLIQACQGRN